MTKDQAARLFTRVQALATAETSLSDKDVDILGKLLGSEPMMKALAIMYSQINAAPMALLKANLEDVQQRADAIRLQGQVFGTVHAIEGLFALATVEEPEEEETE